MCPFHPDTPIPSDVFLERLGMMLPGVCPKCTEPFLPLFSEVKHMARRYSLFEQIGVRKYRRISVSSYPKAIAVKVYQSQLLAYAFGQCEHPRCLRPVKNPHDGLGQN